MFPILHLSPQGLMGLGGGYDDKEESSLCPGGRLLSLNVSADEKLPVFQRAMVPYPAAGEWFITLLPKCRYVSVRRGSQET